MIGAIGRVGAAASPVGDTAPARACRHAFAVFTRVEVDAKV